MIKGEFQVVRRKREILEVIEEECFTGWEVIVRKVATHLCLALIVKELKISVEQGRVVTKLNIINH